MSKNDPAFPVEPFEHYGLTKLEWFAGMALQTLRIPYAEQADAAARMAFDVAEAMLAESEKRK